MIKIPEALLIYATSRHGHRGEYLDVLCHELSGKPLIGSPWRHILQLLNAPKLLCATLDDFTLAFALLTLFRSIFFHRVTVGFLLQPGPCLAVHRPIKQRLKAKLFIVLKHLPDSQVLTLLPFSLNPAFSCIAKGFIWDPQLWDWALKPEITASQTPLAQQIQQAVAGRRIVLSLGLQNQRKGTNYYFKIWDSSPQLRKEFLFVSAGESSPQLASASQTFVQQGGLMINRPLIDAELRDLYHLARRTHGLVWACYAPDYDQASGIFGRALQMGVRSVVRQGSFLEKLAHELGQPVTILPWNQPKSALKKLLQLPNLELPPAYPAQTLREQSLVTLRQLLYFDAPANLLSTTRKTPPPPAQLPPATHPAAESVKKR